MKKQEDQMLYCAYRKCTNYDCLRHDRYIPFGVMVLVEKYKCDENGNCKYKLVE